jgi:hypothetical protein
MADWLAATDQQAVLVATVDSLCCARIPRVSLCTGDPWRSAILLVAGDKSGNCRQWYRQAIPRAEQLLEIYLKERTQEEGEER